MLKSCFLSVVSVFVILLPIALKAQSGNMEKTYGGTGGDEGFSVIVSSDSSYIITGGTYSSGNGLSDVYLLKISRAGDTLWTKVYGGGYNDVGYNVIQTEDGGYAAVGYTYSFGQGERDIYFLKTDANGDTLWTRTYGGSDNEMGYSVKQTRDSGYIIIGYTESYGAGLSDMYLVRIDKNGDTLWTRTYGGTSLEEGRCVETLVDGGYIITGYTQSYGAGLEDVYVIRTDSIGDTLWTRTFGGGGTDRGYAIKTLSDSSFVIGGYTTSFGSGYEDMYLININAVGDSIWTRTYGGAGDDIAYSLWVTNDNNILLSGFTNSFGLGYEDAYIVLVSDVGDTLWTGTYGGEDYDRSYSVLEDVDGSYILTGYTRSFGAGDEDVYLVRVSYVIGLLSPNGGEVWGRDTVHLITWNVPVYTAFDRFLLMYSVDGGLSYPYYIADVDSGQTQYLWSVDNINSRNCRVKIMMLSQTGDTLAFDTTDTDFMIDTEAPSVCLPLLPLNGLYTQDTLIEFVWHSVEDTLSGLKEYIFQLSTDSLFAVNVLSVDTLDTSIVLERGNGVYYWRVRAKDNAGNSGNWSSVWKFEVDNILPDAPLLLRPLSDTILVSDTVVLEWSEVSKDIKSPVNYVLSIDTDVAFSNPIITDTVMSTSDTVILDDGSYYWRVRAYDFAGNEGPWSDAGHFYVSVSGLKEAKRQMQMSGIISVETRKGVVKVIYRITRPSKVGINLYEITGRRIVTLESDYKKRGEYVISTRIKRLQSGIYFVEFQAKDMREVKRISVWR